MWKEIGNLQLIGKEERDRLSEGDWKDGKKYELDKKYRKSEVNTKIGNRQRK